MGLITMDLFRQLFLLGQAHGTHLEDRRGNVFRGDPVHADQIRRRFAETFVEAIDIVVV
jgi:hypothetical protein